MTIQFSLQKFVFISILFNEKLLILIILFPSTWYSTWGDAHPTVKKYSLQVSPYVRYEMVGFWEASWLLFHLGVLEYGQDLPFICGYEEFNGALGFFNKVKMWKLWYFENNNFWGLPLRGECIWGIWGILLSYFIGLWTQCSKTNIISIGFRVTRVFGQIWHIFSMEFEVTHPPILRYEKFKCAESFP